MLKNKPVRRILSCCWNYDVCFSYGRYIGDTYFGDCGKANCIQGVVSGVDPNTGNTFFCGEHDLDRYMKMYKYTGGSDMTKYREMKTCGKVSFKPIDGVVDAYGIIPEEISVEDILKEYFITMDKALPLTLDEGTISGMAEAGSSFVGSSLVSTHKAIINSKNEKEFLINLKVLEKHKDFSEAIPLGLDIFVGRFDKGYCVSCKLNDFLFECDRCGVRICMGCVNSTYVGQICICCLCYMRSDYRTGIGVADSMKLESAISGRDAYPGTRNSEFFDMKNFTYKDHHVRMRHISECRRRGEMTIQPLVGGLYYHGWYLPAEHNILLNLLPIFGPDGVFVHVVVKQLTRWYNRDEIENAIKNLCLGKHIKSHSGRLKQENYAWQIPHDARNIMSPYNYWMKRVEKGLMDPSNIIHMKDYLFISRSEGKSKLYRKIRSPWYKTKNGNNIDLVKELLIIIAYVPCFKDDIVSRFNGSIELRVLEEALLILVKSGFIEESENKQHYSVANFGAYEVRFREWFPITKEIFRWLCQNMGKNQKDVAKRFKDFGERNVASAISELLMYALIGIYDERIVILPWSSGAIS